LSELRLNLVELNESFGRVVGFYLTMKERVARSRNEVVLFLLTD